MGAALMFDAGLIWALLGIGSGVPMLVGFARRRERLFALLAAVVLAIIAAGTVLGYATRTVT
jgi:hypothetical protein